jgi:hypothetical protein
VTRGLAAAALMMLAACAPVAVNEDNSSAVQSGRYYLRSGAWVNLHQRLLYEATSPLPLPKGVSDSDAARWRDAVASYHAWLGKRSVLHDRELIGVESTLSHGGDVLPRDLPPRPTQVLAEVMPLYRAQWVEDDRVNRAWIARAKPLLDRYGEALARRASVVYGVPFPTRIRVDVSAYAGEFGAYTTGEGDVADVVVSPQDPANQGYHALEAMVHEPSHSIVGPNPDDAIGRELAEASRELGVRPSANLWHAILFYTAGELTRQALVADGIEGYTLNIEGLYAGPFRGYRAPLDTHWRACIDEKVSRDAAIRAILAETAPAKR